jgi:hypothetical protein
MAKRDAYRLLLFVPEADVPEYINQWDVLNKFMPDLANRGIRVLSLFEDEGGDDNGQPMTEADVEKLRRLFRVRNGMSMAVVLNPAGHELARYPLPVNPAQVLKLVNEA